MATHTVISGARIFDGRAPLGTGTVVVEDGVITQVLLGDAGLPGDPEGTGSSERVDGSGMTLLPGLIDAHTHLAGPQSLEQDLRYGVTTVLDMFSFPPPLTAGLRAQVAAHSGWADFRSAGLMAGAKGGWPAVFLPPEINGWQMPGLTGPHDAAAFVADRKAEGSDYLKVFVENGAEVTRPALSADTVAALCTQARAQGLMSVAHAPTLWAFRTAIKAGVDVLTHLPLDGVLEQDEASAAVAAGLVLVPTLTMMQALTDLRSTDRILADPRLTARLAPGVADALAAGDRAGLPTSSAKGASYANAVANLALFQAAGAPVLVGTDANDQPGKAAPVLHGASQHLELELLVEAGLTPADVLRGATAMPAAAFGLTDRGTIAPGLRADLLLVQGDPLTDITATRDITRVWRVGAPAPH